MTYRVSTVPRSLLRLSLEWLRLSPMTKMDPSGTVSSTLCTSRREGDGLLVTLTAECVEEIGRAVPIYTDPTEESGG